MLNITSLALICSRDAIVEVFAQAMSCLVSTIDAR